MISNKNLKDLNSLKLEYSCKNYFELNNHQDLFELSKEIRKSSTRFWILGAVSYTHLRAHETS